MPFEKGVRYEGKGYRDKANESLKSDSINEKRTPTQSKFRKREI